MDNINKSLDVFVTFRYNTKTGEIDTTITSKGCALSKMWALNNTTRTTTTLVIHRESGKVVFACRGRANDLPKVAKEEKLGSCKEYGIPLDFLHSIKDKRFDKEDAI